MTAFRSLHRVIGLAALSATLMVPALASAPASGLPGVAGPVAVPACWGKIPTIVGTPGNDTIRGSTPGSDVIHGLGGNDVIILSPDYEEDAGDWVCGGTGVDYLKGSLGPDHLRGGDGRDDIDGWIGADVAEGRAGHDRVKDCEGENGVDDDILRGGPGADVLCSQWGDDRVYAGRGNDVLHDLACYNGTVLLRGGPGADTFDSATEDYDGGTPCGEDPERDLVYGGRGIDSAVVSIRDVVRHLEFLTRVR